MNLRNDRYINHKTCKNLWNSLLQFVCSRTNFCLLSSTFSLCILLQVFFWEWLGFYLYCNSKGVMFLTILSRCFYWVYASVLCCLALREFCRPNIGFYLCGISLLPIPFFTLSAHVYGVLWRELESSLSLLIHTIIKKGVL